MQRLTTYRFPFSSILLIVSKSILLDFLKLDEPLLEFGYSSRGNDERLIIEWIDWFFLLRNIPAWSFGRSLVQRERGFTNIFASNHEVELTLLQELNWFGRLCLDIWSIMTFERKKCLVSKEENNVLTIIWLTRLPLTKLPEVRTFEVLQITTTTVQALTM